MDVLIGFIGLIVNAIASNVFLAVLWWPFCIILGIFAARRYHRSGWGWFLLSIFISPLLAFLLLLALGKKPLNLTAALEVSPSFAATGQRVEPTL